MRFFALASALCACAPAVLAQNATLLTGLSQALNSTGHSALATVVAQINTSDSGRLVLNQLSNGSPYVLFAPTDNALKNVPSNVSSNADMLADVIAYHVVAGNFTNVSTTYPNVTLGRTLLNDSRLVQLEGSQSQVVAWATRADGKVHVLNQINDSVVTNTSSFGNITIITIDHVLTIPESLSQTVPVDNASLTGVQSALTAFSVPFYNASTNQTSNTTFFDVLNTGLRGFTFFAPNNSAIQNASSGLTSLASNLTALTALFQNHLINGSTVYSPLLASANQTSAAGEPLTFLLNATGHYVTSGNFTAQIVQPDVLLPNGVVHIIDGVLANTDSDASAASSAASSASSAATQTQSATAPIGFSATATASGSGASGSGSSGSSNAAARGAYAAPGTLHVFSTAATFLGVLGGMMMVAV